jgi:vacuolar-type H+-ATPase subunit I/STV1
LSTSILKAQQQAEFLQNRGEAEMEMSDNEELSESSENVSKRKRAKQEPTIQTQESMLSLASEWIGSSQLRDENDVLKCQLEALKNEVDLVKQEAQNNIDSKDKQFKCLQMALQGMQQQLLNATQQSKKAEEKLKRLQVAYDKLKQLHVTGINSESADIDKDAAISAALDSGAPAAVTVETDDRYEEVDSELLTDTLTTATPVISDARFIALISTFLHVHPFGANIDYIWSYLNRLGIKIRSSQLEELLDKYPSVFGTGDDNATADKRWRFIGYEQ